MSRDIKKATPFMQWFWDELRTAVYTELKLTIFLVDVDRDWKVQRAYYSQGRESLVTVNYLRKIAGLPAINAVQNKHKITWTLKSKHIVNLDNESPYDNLSRAIDIGLKAEDGKYVGDGLADLNEDGKKDYYQIGEIGERIGGMRVRWLGRQGDLAHWEEIT